MAGTDKTKAAAHADSAAPAVILVGPQLGENIGMVARAMLNCGLLDLRLVRPRDGWPNPAAEATASGALAVIEGAKVYDELADAVSGLNRVYATTARARDMVKPVLTPRAVASELRAAEAAGDATGFLFGPERSGLDNHDLTFADALVTVPLNPAFSSLNLAQAVLLLGYEWRMAGDATPYRALPTGDSRPATKEELMNFLSRLEQALDDMGFFHPAEKRYIMVRNLRNVFQRAEATEQELRTLHGVVSALRGAKLGKGPQD